MTLKAKHIVEEINGTRCTVVEKGATAARIDFLKKLLEFNHYEVIVVAEAPVVVAVPVAAETPVVVSAPVVAEAPVVATLVLYTIGVTDLVFNPVIAVYELSLKTTDGKKVSPAYWNQYSTDSIDEYWDFVK